LRPAWKSYDYKHWRYWLRLSILVWIEWMAIFAFNKYKGYDQRLYWVLFSTIIVVKPVMVVSFDLGIQRVAGMGLKRHWRRI
jgi:hypothetical protein